jgi:hypothetical protein
MSHRRSSSPPTTVGSKPSSRLESNNPSLHQTPGRFSSTDHVRRSGSRVKVPQHSVIAGPHGVPHRSCRR